MEEWSAFADVSMDTLTRGLQKLSVEAVSTDYPLGSSKGYCNRAVFLGLPQMHACVDVLWPRLAFLAHFILQDALC